ncbi:hypothetical protein Taro_053161 [Colocasia esculenta]|uniref:Ubiquitin-conjugating enzyme E2C-binding protein n=1 Tax=Colocasia esculenta TaxID=4460 RepID=A0A843XLD7_COLES|nr:hypothetical protein [Colocasia esculenta]
MALPAPPPPPRRSPRRWRFTWEALAHMPTLRLFLFNTEVDPSRRCSDLSASLRLEESLLLISWTEEGAGNLALRVPLPRVLIDPGSPVQSVARSDYIEVKLALLLPLDHPMSVNLSAALDVESVAVEREGGSSDFSLPLILDSGAWLATGLSEWVWDYFRIKMPQSWYELNEHLDIKILSAGDVHFYCRICRSRLTRRPPRNFVEIPSADWREVADNWFGTCCCSFGGASEKLVHEYIKGYNCSEGTCLLDGPSVIICKDDLDGYIFQKCSGELVGNSAMPDPMTEREDYGSANASEGIHMGCKSLGYLPQKDGGSTGDHTERSLNERKITVKADWRKMNSRSSDQLLGSSVNQVFSKESVHCCADETNGLLDHACGGPCDVSLEFSRMKSSIENLASQASHNFSHNGSLGGGFLIKTSNLSNDVQWLEFLCRQCSSLLGSYPTVQGVNDPVDGGIRLFKCFVSTSMDPVGHHNIFRNHTLQKVFVSLLLESATDELSFRTIVRDVRTKSPILQIVLLNSKAWCISGDCFENETTRCLSKLNLRPVVKVLFSVCSSDYSSSVEEWVTKKDADEVYMMMQQAKELLESLKLAHDTLPPLYSLFQGMQLSYIEM